MDLSDLPMAHFPLVSIALVWLGVPLAEYLCRKLKNPVVGMSSYGFFLINGMLHFASTVVRGLPPVQNPGFHRHILEAGCYSSGISTAK